MGLKNRIVMFVLSILILFNSDSYSQLNSHINGLVFADYYYYIENHDPSMRNQNAFQFRRIYLMFENNIKENINIRFRLESAHPKFGQSGPLHPFVKHAYLGWSGLLPNHTLYIGIAETNAFSNTEEYWGYRSIEATIMDLNKICSSADMGIALKGNIGKTVHHWLTLYNGTGYKNSEQDQYKKIGYAFWVTPVHGLILEGYFDYEKQDPNNAIDSATDYFGASSYRTVKAFLGYNNSVFTLGAEWFRRINKQAGATDASGTLKTDVNKQGFSFFGSWVMLIPKIKVFARYDQYEPNTKDGVWISDRANGTDDEFSYIFTGIDFMPEENIHFMPNIMIKRYALDTKDADVTIRFTLYYQFDIVKIKNLEKILYRISR